MPVLISVADWLDANAPSIYMPSVYLDESGKIVNKNIETKKQWDTNENTKEKNNLFLCNKISEKRADPPSQPPDGRLPLMKSSMLEKKKIKKKATILALVYCVGICLFLR